MYVYTCLHSFMTTTDRCTSLVFASALFSIFFFDTSMSNNCDNNSKRKSKSKKNAVWWFKLEFQRFMNPLLLCIYREKELFFHFFLPSKKFIYLFFKCDDCANHFCGFRHQLLLFFAYFFFFTIFLFFPLPPPVVSSSIELSFHMHFLFSFSFVF